MYLLDKPWTYLKDPWPHMVIPSIFDEDYAQKLLDDFPTDGDVGYAKTNQIIKRRTKGFYDKSDSYSMFMESYRQHEQRLIQDLDSIFDQPYDNCFVDRPAFAITYHNKPFQVAKDWHLDEPDKKYKIMIYLGSGPGGEFEMKNDQTGEVRTYPYEHNTALIFHNSGITNHRYYASNCPRKTIALAVKYNDPDKRSY